MGEAGVGEEVGAEAEDVDGVEVDVGSRGAEVQKIFAKVLRAQQRAVCHGSRVCRGLPGDRMLLRHEVSHDFIRAGFKGSNEQGVCRLELCSGKEVKKL